jgi:hypothetical protein
MFVWRRRSVALSPILWLYKPPSSLSSFSLHQTSSCCLSKTQSRRAHGCVPKKRGLRAHAVWWTRIAGMIAEFAMCALESKRWFTTQNKNKSSSLHGIEAPGKDFHVGFCFFLANLGRNISSMTWGHQTCVEMTTCVSVRSSSSRPQLEYSLCHC